MALVLYFFLLGTSYRYPLAKKLKYILSLLFFLFCLPGVLFITCNIFSAIRFSIWYIEFRSLDKIEVLSAFWALFIGFVTNKSRSGRVKWKKYNKYIYLTALLLVLAPYLEPVVFPAEFKNKIGNEWKEGVCLQTTGFTCGAASLATVFNHYGKKQSEKEIARSTFASLGGVEEWYLVRYARHQGYNVKCMYLKDLSKTAYPSLLAVRFNNIPHFIAFLGKVNEKYIIGDPLSGKSFLTKAEFFDKYVYDELTIVID